MYKKSLAFFKNQNKENEVIICRITNMAGIRIFSDSVPTANVVAEPLSNLYNGLADYDGNIEAGSGFEDVLRYEGRVLNWGILHETLMSYSSDLIASAKAQEISTMQITLNNADKYFSRLLGRENLLSAAVEVLVGFGDISASDFLKVFSGKVNRLSLTDAKATLYLQVS